MEGVSAYWGMHVRMNTVIVCLDLEASFLCLEIHDNSGYGNIWLDMGDQHGMVPDVGRKRIWGCHEIATHISIRMFISHFYYDSRKCGTTMQMCTLRFSTGTPAIDIQHLSHISRVSSNFCPRLEACCGLEQESTAPRLASLPHPRKLGVIIFLIHQLEIFPILLKILISSKSVRLNHDSGG